MAACVSESSIQSSPSNKGKSLPAHLSHRDELINILAPPEHRRFSIEPALLEPNSEHDICGEGGLDALVLPSSPSGAEETAESNQYAELTSMYDGQNQEPTLLVKTVQNQEWPKLLELFVGTSEEGEEGFYTPLSLPPVDGRGMQLYGSVDSTSCGIMLNGREVLDPANPEPPACWPPGIFAKSEFSMDKKSGRPRANSAGSAAMEVTCSVSDLRRYNLQRQFRHFGKWETQTHDRPMPYNEVFTRAHQSMLVGLFSRSCERQHLMFLMAARQEVKETVGLWLPLFVHTPEDGYQPFPSHSQTRLLKDYIVKCRPFPRSPSQIPAKAIDVSETMDQTEAILFHASYNAGPKLVAQILFDEQTTKGNIADVMNTGMARAASCDNSTSAKVLVKEAIPILLNEEQVPLADPCIGSGDGGGSAGSAGSGNGVAVAAIEAGADASRGAEVDVDADGSGSSQGRRRSRPGALSIWDEMNDSQVKSMASQGLDLSKLVDASGGSEIQNPAAPVAGATCRSHDMLVAMGAYVLTSSITSGLTRQRLTNACSVLSSWLEQADSLAFRITSWYKHNDRFKKEGGADKEGGPGLGAHLSGKAVENRSKFLSALEDLRACIPEATAAEGASAVAKYSWIVKVYNIIQTSLGNRPSLRLELLRYILGLDSRYTKTALTESIQMALSSLSSDTTGMPPSVSDA